jgi:hypothetical protein
MEMASSAAIVGNPDKRIGKGPYEIRNLLVLAKHFFSLFEKNRNNLATCAKCTRRNLRQVS